MPHGPYFSSRRDVPDHLKQSISTPMSSGGKLDKRNLTLQLVILAYCNVQRRIPASWLFEDSVSG
jgi:hypothetical protein